MRHILIETTKALQRVCELVGGFDTLYCDTETTCLNPRQGKLVAVQFMREGGWPVIVDWRKAEPEWAAMLSDLFVDKTLVFHNANFDLQWLWANGVRTNRVYDTFLASKVLEGGSDVGHTLKDVVARYCGVKLDKTQREWFFDLDSREEWLGAFPDEELEYMALDVHYLPQVKGTQRVQLKALRLSPVADLENRCVPAIAWMESNGVRVNVEGWRKVIQEKEVEARQREADLVASDLAAAILASRGQAYSTQMALLHAWEAERDAHLESVKREYEAVKGDTFMMWGEFKTVAMGLWREEHPRPNKPTFNPGEINWGSSSQLKAGLAHLGIVVETTEADELEKLSAKHPVLTPLLEYRKAEKFVSTYGESLLARVEADGRIHPNYQQLGTETGRMSCQRPNWQNIPARTTDGKRLRECVVASPGHKLLTADYSIIELRILADLSGDKNMLDMFASGMDLHTYTARKMFKLPDSMTDEQVKAHKLPSGLKARDIAKTINYGVAYGQSAYGFSLKFGVDTDTAQGFIDAWYESYPQARKWLESMGEWATQCGYSTTALGRRRNYDIPKVPNRSDTDAYKLYKRALGSIRRQGMNTPIQGTCADVVKLALSLLYVELKDTNAKLVACVHDEFVVECPESDVNHVKSILAACMYRGATCVLKKVTIPDVDVSVSDYWSK